MLRAHVVALVATLTMMSAVIAAQSPADDKLPSFAVASVKPNRSGERNAVTVPLQNNGRYAITKASLELLINFAFQRPSFEIDGMPGWAATEKFDVEARADGTPPAREIFLMLRSLLVDRFKLIARNDTRKMPVYVLVAVKSGQTGPQLRRHIDDSGCLKEPVARGIPDPAKPLPPPLCGGFSGAPNLGRLAAQRIELDRLGQALAGHLGRRVIDRTGPTGPFDLTLEWTPQQPRHSRCGTWSMPHRTRTGRRSLPPCRNSSVSGWCRTPPPSTWSSSTMWNGPPKTDAPSPEGEGFHAPRRLKPTSPART